MYHVRDKAQLCYTLATSQIMLAVAIFFSTSNNELTRIMCRTSFKRVQERIAVFYQRRQQEKICGGNKPSLVEEEPEEIGMCIERSAGKMAATIPVPSAGTKADHCIKITDMSSR